LPGLPPFSFGCLNWWISVGGFFSQLMDVTRAMRNAPKTPKNNRKKKQ
jgi:hypothetical protein